MSELLDALILQRKQQALDYKAYLARIVELTKRVKQPETESSYPISINSPARRALYDNLKDVRGLRERLAPEAMVADCPDASESAALAVDDAVRAVKKADWRGNRFKEREVHSAIRSVLGDRDHLADTIFEIVKSQRDY